MRILQVVVVTDVPTLVAQVARANVAVLVTPRVATAVITTAEVDAKTHAIQVEADN